MNAVSSCELTLRRNEPKTQTFRKWGAAIVMYGALGVIALIAVPVLLLGSVAAIVWWCADRLIRLLESP